MRVIGTAGHVDHGKSTLVEALTGIHPDRLKEEQEREMTIDLGFAWLTLPGGEEIGIVDVPGHRDFIENMLAGVGGIDAALFVVAADESVMPQTREHLAILDLLQIDAGVVALTKADLIDDPDWLDLVESELEEVLLGTALEGAKVVRVSAKSGEGLADLLDALESTLLERPERVDLGRPRLPIDRVFSIPGFGTVVTGTLSDGQLKLGDELELLPARLRGRVRGLQTHKQKENHAVPGSRTAVNVSGVALEAIRRGDILAHPGTYTTTRRMDVAFRLLPGVTSPLAHNTEVKLFIGAAEVVARVRLIASEELAPGSEGWLQIETKEPVVAVRGDRYILRRPSPGETLGGGVVLDPIPTRRHKRFSETVKERFEALSRGKPDEILLQALQTMVVGTFGDLVTRSRLDVDSAQAAIEELSANGVLVNLDGAEGERLKNNDLVIAQGSLERLQSNALRYVSDYHQAYPLRTGLPREELRSRLRADLRLVPANVQGRVFNLLLPRMTRQGLLAESGPLVHIPGHTIRFTPGQQAHVNKLLSQFEAARNAPPSVKECVAAVGEDVYQALIGQGELVEVSNEVVFNKAGYERMVGGVRDLITRHGSVSAAQVRDHFNTSRKYVLALLEHLDAVGVTVREGDVRRLK